MQPGYGFGGDLDAGASHGPLDRQLGDRVDGSIVGGTSRERLEKKATFPEFERELLARDQIQTPPCLRRQDELPFAGEGRLHGLQRLTYGHLCQGSGRRTQPADSS